MNKKIWIILGVALLLAGLAFAAKKLGWIGKTEGLEVEIAEAKKSDITEKVSASGKIKPETEVKISADVSGEIIELNVKEGDSVRVGQLLFRIRPDNYQSLLDRAKAALNTAKAALAQASANKAQAEARLIRTKMEYERSEKLHLQKVISDADWDNAKANYEVGKNELKAAESNLQSARFGIENAEATLKDAAENLRKTTVFAPLGGIVSRLNVELGERVVGTAQMTGTEVLRIANLKNMEVEVEVNENDIVRLEVGDTAEIEVDAYAYARKKFSGTVTSIAHSAVETASAEAVTEFKVDVRLNPKSYQELLRTNPYPFRPGMTASLEIATDFRPKALSVPLAAVVARSLKKENEANGNEKAKEEMTEAEKRRQDASEQKAEVVFVYANGKAEMRKVKTGIADFEHVEIIEGLKEGEKVITGPFSALTKTLNDGDEVRIKSKDKEKGKRLSISF